MQAITNATRAPNPVEKAIPLFMKYTFGLFSLWLHKVWHGRDVSDSNIVLVLTAKKDHNGALSIPDFGTTIKLHSQKNMKIVYRKVGSIEDCNRAIVEMKSRNNRIKGLWLNAHGDPRGFDLGKPRSNMNHMVLNYRHFGNAQILQLAHLEPDAAIILRSCSTGHVDQKGASCVAQTIATLAPNRKVFAPITDINGVSTHFTWKKGSLCVKFTTPKKSQAKGFLRKIANFINNALFVYSSGHFGKNDTAVFKSHQVC